MDRVSRSPAIFDLDKLNWLNGVYIRGLGSAALADRVQPYLEEAGLKLRPVQREVVAAAIQSSMVTLEEAPKYAFVFVENVDLAVSPHLGALAVPGVEAVFDLLEEALAQFEGEYFSVEEGRAVMQVVANASKGRGVKGKAIYMPLRVALTGRNQGPELFYLVAGLGRSRILARLAAARRLLPAG